MRLLAVDDSRNHRLTLSALLENEGFEVDVAGSVAEARAWLDAPARLYDLALIDLHLGDGLGTELVSGVRARCPETKIVMMSGSSQANAAPFENVDASFEKGAAFSELMALLWALLRR